MHSGYFELSTASRIQAATICLLRCGYIYIGVAVFPEFLTFIQCMWIEINVPQQCITVRYKRYVGGRRAGDCKHFLKLRAISGFRCDLNGTALFWDVT